MNKLTISTKLITGFIAFIIVFGAVLLTNAASYTLYEHFSGQLPLLGDRAHMALECGVVDSPSEYNGSLEQNIDLLDCLQVAQFGSGGEELEPTSIGTGATSADPNVTYVTDTADDFAVGGTDSSAPFYFDTSSANLTAGGINGTKVVDGNTYSQDGTGIQNAIDDCSADSTCGTVFLPSGSYSASTSTILQSGIQLIGEYASTTVVTCSGNSPCIRTFSKGTDKTAYSGIAVKNLTIQSENSGAGIQEHILWLSNVNGLDVENNILTHSTISEVPYPGLPESLFVEHSQNVNVEGNFIYNVSGNGVQINATDYFVVDSNIVASSTDDGIDIDWDFVTTGTTPSRWGTVSNNVVSRVTSGNGIRVENSSHITVSGNNINDTDGAACIIVNNSTESGAETRHVTVSGNTVQNCQQDGISIVAAQAAGVNETKFVNVVGNTVYTSALNEGSNIRAGIEVNATSTQVVGNFIFDIFKNDTNGGGIVVNKADDVYISNNTIASTTNGIVLWNGSGGIDYASTTIVNNVFSDVDTEYTGEISQTGVYIKSIDYGTSGLGPLIGFGEPNPADLFEFKVDRSNDDTLKISDSGTGQIKLIFSENGFDAMSLFYDGSGAGDAGNKFNIRNENGGSDQLTVTRGGDVGIGDNTPDYRFDVGDVFSVDTLGNATTTGQLVVGSPTGGGQGTGTINAQAIYDDGTGPLTDYLFDLYYDGKLRVEDAQNPKITNLNPRVWSIDETKEFVEQERHLPWIDGRDMWKKQGGKFSLGQLVGQFWEAIEQVWLQVVGVDNKVNLELEEQKRINESLQNQINELKALIESEGLYCSIN